MQRNNLSNINTNKIYQDTLSNQMSTQKKVNRPSDDPVVAIRALRLRSSVTEVTQYYSKNIPDAESWLSVTEDALKNLSQIMTNMIGQCTKGANGDLTTSDRQIILEQLKALGQEVYSTGDADYAGRYVFTGYRTDIPLSFDREQKLKYEITEQIDSSAIDSVVHVNTKNAGGTDLTDINEANFAGINLDEEDISSAEVYRIRLSYNNCLDAQPSISYTDSNGVLQTWGAGDIQTMHSYDDPYSAVQADDDAIVFIQETGEILLGKNRYETLMATRDDDTTTANEAKISVTYQKESWKKGDLRPEHYFYCVTKPGEADSLEYNKSYLQDNAERQDIEYDVGFNQTIRVNSTADECFQHGIGREVDDMVKAMEDMLSLEAVKKDLEKAKELNVGNETALKKIQTQLDAVEKALTLTRDKEQKLFEKGITAFQGYLDDASMSITECGTRSSKLSLIKNRMQNQKTTFETLKSENEDVDITDVAIKLSSAELTYQAALMATGKVAQTTLLNYI